MGEKFLSLLFISASLNAKKCKPHACVWVRQFLNLKHWSPKSSVASFSAILGSKHMKNPQGIYPNLYFANPNCNIKN